MTLDGLAAIVSKGFASADKKFTALSEDILDLRKVMATKEDIANMATKDDVRAIVREELKPITSELAAIRRGAASGTASAPRTC